MDPAAMRRPQEGATALGPAPALPSVPRSVIPSTIGLYHHCSFCIPFQTVLHPLPISAIRATKQKGANRSRSAF